MALGLHIGHPQNFKRYQTAIPLRVAEVQGRIPSQVRSYVSGRGKVERIPVFITAAQSDLALSYVNWYTSSTAEVDGPAPYTIVAAALECPNGQVVPLYFSGGRTRVMASGDNDIQCDRINPSQAGYSGSFPSGTYWIKHNLQVSANGLAMPTVDETTTNDNVTGAQCGWYDPTNTTPSSADTAGQFTVTGTALQPGVYFTKPIVLGTPAVDGASYIGFGDSIATGFGEASSGAHRSIGGVGLLQRAAYNGGTNPVPLINISHTSAQVTLATNYTKWQSYLKYARYAMDEYGTNDVTSNSFATVQPRFDTFWSLLRAGGIQKILRPKLIVRTTSTDSWISVGNQTTLSSWQSGNAKYQFESYIDTKVGDGTLNATVDLGTLKDTGNTDVWKTNGATNYYTSDGIHPNTTASILAAAAYRAQMWLT